jgi:Tol biopolymer transport system component
MKRLLSFGLGFLLAAPLFFAQTKELKIVRIWSGSDVDSEGAPSKDGRYISFVDWDTGDLAIRDLSTGEKRRLTNKGNWYESDEFALYSMWSPDNNRLVYNWWNKDLYFDLRIFDLKSSKEHILYQNKEVNWVEPHDWSSDGKLVLAILSPEEQKNQIVLINIADASVKVIKTLGRDYPAGKMNLSPDGKYIAYDLPQKGDSPDHDIYLLSSDGKSEFPLVEYPANDWLLGWTPDGEWILFSSDRTGTNDTWAIRVANGKPQGEPQLITRSMGEIWPMGFTKTGSFYYGNNPLTSDAYVAAIDLNNGKLLSPPEKVSQRYIGSNMSTEWSRDGKNIAYVSRRNRGSTRIGSSVLCIRSLETGKARELTPQLKSFGGLRWSPDGHSILVYGVDEKDKRGFFTIDVQTGNLSLVQEQKPDTNIRLGSWSMDGKKIFYWQNNLKEKMFNRIMLFDLETKKEKEIFSRPVQIEPINNLALSPDGQIFAYTTYSKEKQTLALKTISAAGGETRELYNLKPPQGFRSIAWTADGHGILFSKAISDKAEEPKCELWRIPAEGGAAQNLGFSMDQLSIMSVHPDGKHIAYMSGLYKGEVWVMENFLPEGKSR